jgi:hypothetical protein
VQLATKITAGFVEYFTGNELEIATVGGLLETLNRVGELDFSQRLQAFNQIGIALLQGIAAGFEIGLSALLDGVTVVGTAMIDEFKAFFGIASPSTVFAEFGLNLIQGLVSGIINNASLVATALTSTIGEGIASFGEGLQLPELGISELLGGGEAEGGEAGGIAGLASSITDNLGEALNETGDTVTNFLAPAFEEAGTAGDFFTTSAEDAGIALSTRTGPSASTAAGVLSGSLTPALSSSDATMQRFTASANSLNSLLAQSLNKNLLIFADYWSEVGKNADEAIEPLTEMKNILAEIASYIVQIAGANVGAGAGAGAGTQAAAAGVATGTFSSFSSVQSTNSTNNFNLTVNSQKASQGLARDFSLMQALA